MLYSSIVEHPDVSEWSDASGSWGCGAVWSNKWFQVSWREVPKFEKAPIAAKELLPMVLAATLWGNEWGGLTVQCNCDNEAMVASIMQGGPRRPTRIICSDASFSLRPSFAAQLPHHIFQAS